MKSNPSLTSLAACAGKVEGAVVEGAVRAFHKKGVPAMEGGSLKTGLASVLYLGHSIRRLQMARGLIHLRGPASLFICLAMLTPSISLGQTTTPGKVAISRPARTFPSSPANARILLDAYRVSLAKPAVRTIARDEIRRQLSKNRPVLFIEGYWIVPVDMSRVYRNPSVRSALKTSIATGNGKPGRLIQNLSNSELGTRLTTDIGLTTAESALGLAILPMQRSPVLNMDAELDKFLASMGVGKDAFQQTITDFFGIDDAIVIGVGILVAGGIGWALGEVVSEVIPEPEPFPFSDSGDIDHDDKPNSIDDDDDGDGFKDKQDYAPWDPKTHICDCGNLGGPTRIIDLTSTSSVASATSVINMMKTAKLESVRANTISLGLAASGNVANNPEIRAMVINGGP
jgi:hypothetical protein